MEIKELRQLPDDELRSEIEKAREKIFRMRFQGKGKDLENPGLFRVLRKDIARMNTVLSERRVVREKGRGTAPAAVPAQAAAGGGGQG